MRLPCWPEGQPEVVTPRSIVPSCRFAARGMGFRKWRDVCGHHEGMGSDVDSGVVLESGDAQPYTCLPNPTNPPESFTAGCGVI